MSSEPTHRPRPDGRPGDRLGWWRNGVIHQVYVREFAWSRLLLGSGGKVGGNLRPDSAGRCLLEAVR